MKNFLGKLFNWELTISRGSVKISKTREFPTPPNRELDPKKQDSSFPHRNIIIEQCNKDAEVKIQTENKDRPNKKSVLDSLICPYCQSKNFKRRGFRKKKLEKIQLYQCLDCVKTFTPHSTKGKHYPLETVFEAISLYNLGYSLEESCRRVNSNQQKTRPSADSCDSTQAESDLACHLTSRVPQNNFFVKSDKKGVEVSEENKVNTSTTTEKKVGSEFIQPSTLSNWITEFKEYLPYLRMREFIDGRFSPKEQVITATLAHQQLFRYRFHQVKCNLIMREDFRHHRFRSLQEFLETVPAECPHQYFQRPAAEVDRDLSAKSLPKAEPTTGEADITEIVSLRASEAPLAFSKTQMIVRSKQNFAVKTGQFVLQGVKERKNRHEALQKFMLYNDSVTVATEVPVYLTRDDLLHMKTQLGFEIYQKENSNDKNPQNPADGDIADIDSLPKLITGHIDILQIRNGQIHILDYKPKAEKERPIEQLTLYAMALSRLTGLRLFEFKCAWFDEKDYFEFYPLHVLHKPKKGRRRRKVYTMEGIYDINKNERKILTIKPITNY